jgi:hypothetical protein
MTCHIRFLFLGLALGAGACSTTAAFGPSERPGIGTTWGEARESRVSRVAFERDDPEQPIAMWILHYDDREGVRALAGGATSFPEEGSVGGVAAGAVGVRLIDDRGWPLPTFRSGGRLIAEGRRGQRYSIEIANWSAARIEAVATVDGLDVMDGEQGSIDKRGYVLRPGQIYRIDGFRRSQSAVAAFRFGSVGESYAAQTGDDTNVGVIGVAFFAERGAPPFWRSDEAARRATADPFPDGFAHPPPGADR